MNLTAKQRSGIAKAVAQAKAKGVTALKIEFEGVFGLNGIPYPHQPDRNADGNCAYCEEGIQTCEFCNSEGENECSSCEGGGEVYYGHNDNLMECPDCEGRGIQTCSDCDGDHSWTCGECNGNWQAQASEAEDDAPTPEPEPQPVNPNWQSCEYVHDFLLAKLEAYGLSKHEFNPDAGTRQNAHLGEWSWKKPVIYSKVYHDGTVDIEWSITISLADNDNIWLMEKLNEAWLALGEAIGNGVGTNNAGMHMSLIFDPDGIYPSPYPYTPEEDNRYTNFRKSMLLLMPALYFLGASGKATRSCTYRNPTISDSHKYSAIYYRAKALEFRVFDPCYDKPMQFFDNFAVMVKCLNYWTDNYTRNYLDSVTGGKATKFAKRSGGELDSFYSTYTQLELLNQGLKLIKPDYKSITELKAEREFKVNKSTIKKQLNEFMASVVKDYDLYRKRQAWEAEYQKLSVEASTIYNHLMRSGDSELGDVENSAEVFARAKEQAELEAERIKAHTQSLEEYRNSKINSRDASCGDYSLVLG